MQKQLSFQRCCTVLLALFMLAAISMAMPATAQAERTIKWTNETTKKLFLAVRYLDAVAGEWVTRGWWSVEPLSASNIKLNTNKRKTPLTACSSLP